MSVKQVVCMKWGTLYGPDYVNKLYAMTRANISGELRFVCLTDDPTGVRAEVECLPCPALDNVHSSQKNAGWRKVTLFGESSALFDMTGDWLFIDLDVVVTGNLDDFFNYEPDLPFVVMRNWTQPKKKIGNTSVYRFRVGCAPHLLAMLTSGDFESYLAKYRNSQTFISNEIGDGMLHFWPAEWCALFKIQSIPPWPIRYLKAPIIPQGSRIIAFPGMPNPPEAAEGVWPEKKWYKKIYKYILPALWIKEIWDQSEQAVKQK